MSGNRRDGSDTRCARRCCFQRGPQPASRRPLRRAPPRYAVGCRCRRQVGQLLREVSVSSPPTISIQGNKQRGSFLPKESAPSPPGVFKISSVSHSVVPEGRETKTPPERGLGRGSGNRTVEGAKPFRLRESARTANRTPCRRRSFRLNFPACSFARWSSLAVSPTTAASEGRGV